MMVDDLLEKLDAVRPTARGWRARCPAHEDRRPSLSVREGAEGVLLRCWSGCRLEEVCSALSISIRDLFYAPRSGCGSARQTSPPRPPRLNRRKQAAMLEDAALTEQLRAERILKAATGVSIERWNEDDLDVALRHVGDAYHGLEWAADIEELAAMLRARAIAEGHGRRA